MMALMSTSLNVVSIAAVFCASLRRRALVCRRRVIFTRSSRAASFGTEGARNCVWAGADATALLAAAGGWATASASAGADGLSAAASTSSFRIWPRLPEPCTSSGERPCSSISLRAAGAGGTPPLASTAGPAMADSSRVGGDLGAGGGVWINLVGETGEATNRAEAGSLASCVLAAAPTRSLMDPSTEPTATLEPSGTLISARTPAMGAGTSKVTLSVSSSSSGSSTLTASPGFLNHCPTVASVTDYPAPAP
jgi:hypothetical protein